MTAASMYTGTNVQQPQLMTSVDGTWQAGVMVKNNRDVVAVHKDLTTGTITSYNLAGNSAAVSNGLTPIHAGGDSHFGVACAVDDQDRIHLAGNCETNIEPLHYMRSAPGDITSWTSVAPPWPLTNFSGPGNQTYNTFGRMSDGRLVYALSQRNDATDVHGDKWFLMVLPLGANDYQPLVGTDGVFGSAPVSPDPSRIYLQSLYVEPRVSGDRLHVWGDFRYLDYAPNGMDTGIWYVYSDDIMDDAAWKRADGTSQTVPLTFANVGGPASGACVTWPGTHAGSGNKDFAIVDGVPHIVVRDQDAPNTVYDCWWTGSVWQNDVVASADYATATIPTRNGVMVARNHLNRWRITPATSVSPSFRLGGLLTADWFGSSPDPILLQRGVVSYMIPDGDIPEIHTFGDHYRCVAL